MRYLLALMLVRRRLAQPLPQQTNENELQLEIATDGSQVSVKQLRLTTQRAKELDEQITDLLYCEAE